MGKGHGETRSQGAQQGSQVIQKHPLMNKLVDIAKSNARPDAEVTSGVHKVRCDNVQISPAINPTVMDLLGSCICAI